VVGRSNGFSSLQDEGVFDFGLHQAIGLWRLLTPRQYPVRNRTKAMANLRDTDVLEKIAAGDRHVIPSFWAVSAFVSGRNADAQAAWSEVHLAGEWISRFTAKADGAGVADLGLLVTRLRKMLETAADAIPQDRDAELPICRARRVTAEWEIGWRRFASAMVISSAAEDPCRNLETRGRPVVGLDRHGLVEARLSPHASEAGALRAPGRRGRPACSYVVNLRKTTIAPPQVNRRPDWEVVETWRNLMKDDDTQKEGVPTRAQFFGRWTAVS